MNEVRLNKTYVKNRLKCFKIQEMRTENVKEKKINLTKFLKSVEEFKEMIKIVKKSFEENFEMKKEDFN